MEDALHQAARATSDQRREYIASILANSITADELTHVEKKKLLGLLDELLDPEVIFLEYYSLHGTVKQEFQQNHGPIPMPTTGTFGSDPVARDKAALQDSYRHKLTEIGLLQPDFVSDRRDNLPEIDTRSGKLKARGYKITPIGRLLSQSVMRKKRMTRLDVCMLPSEQVSRNTENFDAYKLELRFRNLSALFTMQITAT